MLDPTYCILMDCGTIPAQDAINKFYWSMESDENIGGVCGYMKIEPEAANDQNAQESKDFLTEFLNNYVFDIQKC